MAIGQPFLNASGKVPAVPAEQGLVRLRWIYDCGTMPTYLGLLGCHVFDASAPLRLQQQVA